MLKYLLSFILLITAIPTFAQQNTVPIEIDVPPAFEGGSQALAKYLQRNIRYPIKAKIFDVQGQVFLQFFVEKTGEVKEVKVIRGIGYGCDEEAVRVLTASPKWQPALKDDQPVKTSVTLPIKFTLASSGTNSIVYNIDDTYYLNTEGAQVAATLEEKMIQVDTLNPQQALEQHHLKVRKHLIIVKTKE
ncbi:MAG: energy transducer TonB [Thermonemataceae bacterium]